MNVRSLNLAPAAFVIAATTAGCAFFVQFSLTQWGYDDFWSVGLVLIATAFVLLFTVALYIIARLAANLKGLTPSQTLSRHSVIFLPLLLLIRLPFVPEYNNQSPITGFLIVIVSLELILALFLLYEGWTQRNRSRSTRLLDGKILLAIIIGCLILVGSLRLHDRYLLQMFASEISYGSFGGVTREIIYEKMPGKFRWDTEAPDDGMFDIVLFPNENFRAANKMGRLSYEIRLTPSSDEGFIISKGDLGLDEISSIAYDVGNLAGETIDFEFAVTEPFSIGAVFSRIHTLVGLCRWFRELRNGGPASVMPVYWSEPLVYTRDEPGRTNVLLIICDTLRADHVGCLGYELNTTPTIDSLAKNGVLFTQAISQSPWTLPSIASIYTAQLPTTHLAGSRVYMDEMPTTDSAELEVFVGQPPTTDFAGSGKVPFFSKLSRQPNFTVHLRQYGYYLGGVVNNAFLSSRYGMHEGFNDYHWYTGDAQRGSDLACAWLETNAEKKFFLLLHYLDPHKPYVMIDAFRSQLRKGEHAVEEQMTMYDTEIAFTDYQIKRVLDKLSELKLLENTMIIFVSDHGEEFLDHSHDFGLGHGHTLYDELLHVPLIISYPARLPRDMQIAHQVRLIDIFPTICDILELEFDQKGIAGESLLTLMSGEVAEDRVAVSEFLNYDGFEQKAIRTGRYKLIYTPETENSELYDISADPGESVDLSGKEGPIRNQLLDRLRAEHRRGELRRSGRVEVPYLDEATMESLKSLGYIK